MEEIWIWIWIWICARVQVSWPFPSQVSGNQRTGNPAEPVGFDYRKVQRRDTAADDEESVKRIQARMPSKLTSKGI
jgi:hypothetical protein